MGGRTCGWPCDGEHVLPPRQGNAQVESYAHDAARTLPSSGSTSSSVNEAKSDDG